MGDFLDNGGCHNGDCDSGDVCDNGDCDDGGCDSGDIGILVKL